MYRLSPYSGAQKVTKVKYRQVGQRVREVFHRFLDQTVQHGSGRIGGTIQQLSLLLNQFLLPVFRDTRVDFWLDGRGAHRYSPVEKIFRHRGDHVQHYAETARAVAAQRDGIRVAAERGYVSSNPSERLYLILQAHVAGRLAVAGIQETWNFRISVNSRFCVKVYNNKFLSRWELIDFDIWIFLYEYVGLFIRLFMTDRFIFNTVLLFLFTLTVMLIIKVLDWAIRLWNIFWFKSKNI